MGSLSFLMLLLIGIGLLMGGWGAVMLFDPDTAWSLQEWSNRNNGVKSERTQEWEAGQGIGGIGLIIFGIAMFVFAIYLYGEFASSSASQEKTASEIVTTNQSKASQLDQLFATTLSDLKDNDLRGVQHIPWQDAQHTNIDIVYGRCESGDFYAYIFHINDFGYEEIYGYVPNSVPESCKPRGMAISTYVTKPVLDIGSGWYQVYATERLEELITPTRRPPTVTPNATQLQATLDLAIQQQVATARANPDFAITQTIAAAVQATIQALPNPK